MGTCKECANYDKGFCRTMINKPKEKWCFMTYDQAIKAEKDIIDYAFNAKGQCNSTAYKVAAEARLAINSLEDKRREECCEKNL